MHFKHINFIKKFLKIKIILYFISIKVILLINFYSVILYFLIRFFYLIKVNLIIFVICTFEKNIKM